MVVNPSAAAVVISVLVLQEKIQSSCHIVAEEASSTIHTDRSQRRKRKHLRRQADSTNELEGMQTQLWHDKWNEDSSPKQGRENLRSILESSGAAFLQERSLVFEGEHRQSSSTSITNRSSSSDGMDVGTDDSACTNRQWHPHLHSPDIACTNSHPSLWNDPSIHEVVLFDSSEACCNALVDLLGGSYGECSVIDDCRAFTSMTATTQRRLSCPSLGFHPNTVNQKGCTNNDIYSDEWLEPGLKEKMFYPTVKACCEWFFGGEGSRCPVEDVCKKAAPPLVSPPTPTPPAKEPECLWHVDTASQDGCTNDSAYPAVWMSSGFKANMMYSTAKGCCDKMFGNKPCKQSDRACGAPVPPTPPPMQNVGPPPSTPPPTAPKEPELPKCPWHADTVNENGCTNDLRFPANWMDPAHKKTMMHPTAKICCDKMFRSQPCKQSDRACEAPKPTQRPTTRRPTEHPTRKPITYPTRRPTPTPTSKPTPKPILFYVADMSGMCVSDEEAPKPEWIEGFRTYDQCCYKAVDLKSCLKNRPGGKDGGPLRPFQPMGPPQPWYVEAVSGLCVSDSEKLKPSWIKETFVHYDQCCQQARNKVLCMKARPTQLNGVPLATLRPTPTLPTTYHMDFITGMCVSNAKKPMPSYKTAEFEDFNRCCILASSDPEKCMSSKESSLDSDSNWPTPVLPSFYLQESTGLCVDENSVPMPYQIDLTFSDYDKCCEAKSWKKDTCLAHRPTNSPTTVPTWSPSTPWPTATLICPETYDPSGSTVYKRGSEVEVNLVAYRCKPPPYSHYCNKSNFRPPQEDPGSVTKPKTNSNIPLTNVNGDSQLWRDAWERLYACAYSPTFSPTMVPSTSSPTCKTRWHPGNMNKKICTNNADYPSIWSEDPILEVAYFADTADECCTKFYPGKKCRIRDKCNT